MPERFFNSSENNLPLTYCEDIYHYILEAARQPINLESQLVLTILICLRSICYVLAKEPDGDMYGKVDLYLDTLIECLDTTYPIKIKFVKAKLIGVTTLALSQADTNSSRGSSIDLELLYQEVSYLVELASFLFVRFSNLNTGRNPASFPRYERYLKLKFRKSASN